MNGQNLVLDLVVTPTQVVNPDLVPTSGATLIRMSPTPTMLTPPNPTALARLNQIFERLLAFPQIEIVTEHLLHGGMYARTIRLEPGTVMGGSLIKAATILIIEGSCTLTVGDTSARIDGYNVIPGCEGRKQLFITHGQVRMTMIYATSARTVAEAEDEVFAEADQLISRKDGKRDVVTITTRERKV